MTTTSLTIILIVYAVLIAFIVYMEFKLKDRDSHFELVEIAPMKGKNVIDALKELGATDISNPEPTEFYFSFRGENWLLLIDPDSSLVHLTFISMLCESNDLERARAAASQLNNDIPGVFISIGYNRRAAICCSTFTDNTLGFIKAFPQMVNYIAKANYELAEYYRNN